MLGLPPPPQVFGEVHVPQLAMMPPQPSATAPQLAPSVAQVFGTHGGGVQHTLGVPPPPQIEPDAQLPQLITPPQPSPTEPQLAPRPAQVFGTHAAGAPPHWFATPPPS
jgi:hypothetical protein